MWLLDDHPVLDRKIDAPWQDAVTAEVCLAFVGPPGDDFFGFHITDAGDCFQLRLACLVDINGLDFFGGLFFWRFGGRGWMTADAHWVLGLRDITFRGKARCAADGQHDKDYGRRGAAVLHDIHISVLLS